MEDTPDMPKAVLTTKEAAKILGVTTLTLSKWRSLGRGPAWERRGIRLVGYRMEALEAWLTREKESSSS